MNIIKNLTLAALAATLLFQTSITRADDRDQRGDDHGKKGDHNNGDATVNFTKWKILPFPLPPSGGIVVNMVGVIDGGDVGEGTFTGEVLSSVVSGGVTTVEAVYHIHGSKHSFTARIHAVQNVPGIGQTGVITGVVTDGWRKGHAVEGGWTVISPCYEPGSGGFGNCFDVTLEIEKVADAKATFTKWVTDWPNMAGVVGGVVGDGSFTGEVLSASFGGVTKIEALYHFHGSKHSFTARVHVEQTGLQAVINGVVTDGWLKGHAVEGEYTQIKLAHDGITTDAYQGTLEIERDSND